MWDTFFHRFHLPPGELARGACIVDLGANVGYTAAHLAALYPESRIIAVEMDGRNAAVAASRASVSSSRRASCSRNSF